MLDCFVALSGLLAMTNLMDNLLKAHT